MPNMIHCSKHDIDFEALEGCPECIAEQKAERLKKEAEAEMTPEERALAREADVNSPENIGKRIKEAEERATAPPFSIVKVRYYSESTGEASDREYTYFAIDPLKVGDVIQVPVRDTFTKAVVTAVDVPESEIESFRDQVKTIPAGGAIIRDPQIRLSLVDSASEELKETAAELEDITGGQIQLIPESAQEEVIVNIPPALATIETQVRKSVPGLFKLYQEAASLHKVAKARTITTNEDLKPATDDLAIIATCRKAMFSRKTEVVGPYKSQLDAMNKAFDDLMFPVLEADRLTRGQVSEFDTEQRRKAAEAQRIEDEKFRLAQEEMKLKGEHTQELGTAHAPPPVPERTRTDLGTLGGRDNWKARVVDFKLLDDHWKIANESLLNSHARTTKGERPIPGVEFYNDRKPTMRTR